MRPAAMFVLASVLSIVPRMGLAQLAYIPLPPPVEGSVTSPAAGTKSSYRTTVISWQPISGATSYHLEIDDDPNFGSPEVDVTVPNYVTSYTLSGERLKLHERLSAAAYVRINGLRWNADTFTPTYFHAGASPALAVNSQNHVYLAFEDENSQIQLTTSSDWSSKKRLSLADTINTYGLNLAVDENDVAHASWMEQRPTESWVPYYTNSSTGWNLVRIPGTIGGGCSEGSLLVGGGQIDLFYETCNAGINRWTGTDGLVFSRTTIPHNPFPNSVNAARDGSGNLYVASERYTEPLMDRHSALQTSADGWNSHRLGVGRFPSIAVTPSGEMHSLAWREAEDGVRFIYSNSLRGFQEWNELPGAFMYFDQDVLPLAVDHTRSQLHAALPSAAGIQHCSTALNGQAESIGFWWSCARVADEVGTEPDLAIAPDGTIHLAWSNSNTVGYANSFGSFLATNFAPQVRFGPLASVSSAAVVPTTIFDADRDDLSGEIHVGRQERKFTRLGPNAVTSFLHGIYSIQNTGNAFLSSPLLQFRQMGATDWELRVDRSTLPALPVMIEARYAGWDRIVGVFIIMAWNDQGMTMVQGDFVPQITRAYTGALPSAIDISTLPVGEAMVMVTTSDGSSRGLGMQSFTKKAGQTWLVLTKP